jgi:hypothetical protein
MVIVALALLILGALVVDASGRLSANARAKAYAEEAARAAAQKIDPTEGFPIIIPSEARAAIADYCAQIQAIDDDVIGCREDGIVEETGGSQLASVTVEVTVRYEPLMVGFFYGGAIDVSESATANPIQGIVEPELDAFVPPSPIVDTRPVEPGIPIESDTETAATVPSPDPTCPTDTGEPPGGPPEDPGESCPTEPTDSSEPTCTPPDCGGGPPPSCRPPRCDQRPDDPGRRN